MYRERSTQTQRKCQYIYQKRLPHIIFDTETTGLDPAMDEIVELAAIRYGFNEVGKRIELDRLNLLIRPQARMMEKVVAIHGISNEALADKPEMKEVITKIQEFFYADHILIGHNVNFDLLMLSTLYRRFGLDLSYTGAVDTLECARDVLDMEKYTLSDLASECGLDVGLTFHRAIDDVIATSRLLDYCHDEYLENFQYRLEKRPPLYLNYCHFWNGNNKNQRGVWCDTNMGKVFFSTFKKAWFSSKVDIAQYDIQQLQEQVLKKLNIPYEEMCKLTERKYLLLKQNNFNRGRMEE